MNIRIPSVAIFFMTLFLLSACGGGGTSGGTGESESSSESSSDSGNDSGTTGTGDTGTGTTGSGTAGTGSTGTGTTGTGTTGTGNYTLTLTVTAMGTTTTTTLNNLQKPADQNAFCNDTTVTQNLNTLATNGATLTINSCSFSGSTGDISATVNMTSPITMTIPYSVHYVYQ